MSDTSIIGLAKAVAADLCEAALALPVRAALALEPTLPLTALNTLHVQVRPAGTSDAAASRCQLQEDSAIEVLLRKKVSGPTDPVIAELVQLASQIRRFWFVRRRPTGRTETWQRTETFVDFEPGELKSTRTVRARLVIVFRGWSEPSNA